MPILTPGDSKMILFLLSSFALAGSFDPELDRLSEGCAHEAHLSISLDTQFTTWKGHPEDIAAYAETHSFGTRDYATAYASAGDGDWCVSFGTLRNIGEAIPDEVLVVVSVNGKQLKVTDTHPNSFWVYGLNRGDEVRFEFLRRATSEPGACERHQSDGINEVGVVGGTRARTYYTCSSEEAIWILIEERIYPIGPDLLTVTY